MPEKITPNSKVGRGILAAVIIASGMAFLDGSVVNVALPTIERLLHTNIAGLQWIVDAYLLALAALLLGAGALSDRYGRRLIFTFGIGLFTLASLACALAPTATSLILARAIQGIGAAAMVPGSIAIIRHTFAENIQGQVLGLWSGLAGGVAALGPFVGGWLVEHAGWPSIFLINVPLGIVALILALNYVPESKSSQADRIDWPGLTLITVALVALAYGLTEGPLLGWQTPLVIASLIGSFGAVIVFGLVENRSPAPIVNFTIFRTPTVLGANLATLLIYFALNAAIFFLVLAFQQVLGYSPTVAGLALLPPILLITFGSGFGGKLADRIGARTPLIIGPAIVAIGMISFVLLKAGGNYWLTVFPGLVLFGLGMAIVIAPITMSALAVERDSAGVASGVNNAIARIASLLAIAILGGVAYAIFKNNLVSLLNHSGLSTTFQHDLLSQADRLGGIDIYKNWPVTDQKIAVSLIERGLTGAFHITFVVAAVCAAGGSLVATIFIQKTNPSPADVATSASGES